MTSIDLNSDLGENEPARVVADDEAMLRVVTSANVSCGAHAGTPEGIRRTLSDAAAHGVAVGAHPGYPDREGFGRRALALSSAALQSEVERQLDALLGLASAAGVPVRYVKPHGALYNAIARDERQARDVVAAVRAVDPSLVLLGLAGSVVLHVAHRAGLATAAEAFADRGYAPSGELVPRGEPGGVLHDADAVARRMLRLATEGTVRAVDGSDVHVRADSVCVHGDSPGAVAMARAVRTRLEVAGVRLAPFAGATG
ncbi:5-oxoprolinase subunit PxpA [Microbacterium sp. NPDC096154]|uniref:LamB/YcsF family protein n=1 Tax=Microbacterium sp. NPDC096154 TaxID=3155549 RepID=UPI00332B4301